jgi:hypothetical protein
MKSLPKSTVACVSIAEHDRLFTHGGLYACSHMQEMPLNALSWKWSNLLCQKKRGDSTYLRERFR